MTWKNYDHDSSNLDFDILDIIPGTVASVTQIKMANHGFSLIKTTQTGDDRIDFSALSEWLLSWHPGSGDSVYKSKIFDIASKEGKSRTHIY